MRRHSIQPRARKYVKRYGFLSFARQCKETIIGYRIDAVKIASKKVVHKAGEFIGNKTWFAVTKSNDDKIEKKEPVEEISIPLEKREKILNKLIELFKKWNTIKYLNN